jgi:hypothetical protein
MILRLLAAAALAGARASAAVPLRRAGFPSETPLPAYRTSTLAGAPNRSNGTQDGEGSSASFNRPSGVIVTKALLIYVTDTSNNRASARGAERAPLAAAPRHALTRALPSRSGIRAVTFNGTVSTVAGSGAYGGADGVGSAASFESPFGIVELSNGNLVVSDAEGNRIRLVTPGGVVTTLAGSGAAGDADGVGTAATFSLPRGLAVDIYDDVRDTVYIADTNSHKLRALAPDGRVVTLAGSGVAGYADGASATAQLNRPTGVAFGIGSVLFFTDENNHAVRVAVRRFNWDVVT